MKRMFFLIIIANFISFRLGNANPFPSISNKVRAIDPNSDHLLKAPMPKGIKHLFRWKRVVELN